MAMEKELDYKRLLLQFIASLTLCDHMGDVGNDVDVVLKKLGIKYKEDGDDSLTPIAEKLHSMGVTTLYGTDCWNPPEPE